MGFEKRMIGSSNLPQTRHSRKIASVSRESESNPGRDPKYDIWMVKSANAGERTIPPRVPYDVDYDADNSLRITRYSGPHVSSDSLFPCTVDMLNSAFNAVYQKANQAPKLPNNEYTCNKNGLDLQLKGTSGIVLLDYPDLNKVANMIFYFQQHFVMPGLTFEYYYKGQVVGRGVVKMLLAAAVNATGGTDQE
ncbi:hypothetical protein ACLMJK_004728 [Lecanora helva]